MDGRVDAERVEDRLGLLPYLIRVNTELVEQRLLILEASGAGGATGTTDGSAVDGRGGGGSTDVEGQEGDAGSGGTRGLEWRRGYPSLLGGAGGGVSTGGELNRRDREILRHRCSTRERERGREAGFL